MKTNVVGKKAIQLFLAATWVGLWVIAYPVHADTVADAKLRLKVSIEGVSGEVADNVSLLLGINKLVKSSASNVAQIQRAHAEAADDVVMATQPFGFYTPAIKSSLVAPVEAGDAWQAKYEIDLGPQVRFRHIELKVKDLALASEELQFMLENHPFERDRPLDHRAYSAFKNRVLSVAFNSGYLDAKFELAALNISASQTWADVLWVLDTGVRYRFGDIDVQQQILDDDILQKLIDLPRDEYFAPDRLVVAQLALTDSDYFRAVEIDVRKAEAVGIAVPVTIKATPTAGKRYSTYTGYGTDTGPRIGFGAEYRHLNRRGHQLDADLRFSAIKSTLAGEYGIPIGNIKSDRLNFFAQAERAEVGDAEADQFSIGARIEDSWLGMLRQRYLTLSQERFQFGDGPHDDSLLLMPGFALSWQKVDDPLFTRRGVGLAFDIHGGEESLLSDTTFVHTSVSANVVLPLAARGRLLLRGELGMVWADEFAALPPSERFFTGGDRTVRGYGFESLSPENAAGDEIGGEYLSAVSIEVDWLVRGNYGVAAFYDVGSAADSFGRSLNAGVGIGLRYKSPVGLIRLDLAHPLDDPDTDFRLHVTFGPDL